MNGESKINPTTREGKVSIEEKAVVIYTTDHGEIKLSPSIIRKYLVSGQGQVTDQEVMMFLALCKYQRLNPFLREAYLIKYKDSEPATLVVGKDVHVKRASKHPDFDGMQSGVIILEDKKPVERVGSFTLKGDMIVGGWAEGKRKSWSIPRKVRVSFEEFAGKKGDGTLNRQWARMPGVMIEKVAIATCLRALFPEELQALYNAEEMGVAEELGTKPVWAIEEERARIVRLLEDNRDVISDDMASSIMANMEKADGNEAHEIYIELADEIRKMRQKETNATHGYKKGVPKIAPKEEPDDEADILDAPDVEGFEDDEPTEKDVRNVKKPKGKEPAPETLF